MRLPSSVAVIKDSEQTTQVLESETPTPMAKEEAPRISDTLRRALPSLALLAVGFFQSDVAEVLVVSSGIGKGHAA